MKKRATSLFVFFVVILVTNNIYADRFFQKHSTWYEPIPDNPTIHSESDSVINDITEWGESFYVTFNQNPIYTATADSEANPTTVQITGCETGTEPSCGAADLNMWAQGWNVVPIPDHAKTILNDQACNGIYADNIMLIYSSDGTQSWHLYHAKKCNGTWSAYLVRRWANTADGVEDEAGPLTYTNSGNPQPRYDNLGAPSAAKKPINHGLLTYDEVINDRIDHALTFTWQPSRNTGGSYWTEYPATALVDSPTANPEIEYAPITGMRFQLDMTYQEITDLVNDNDLSIYHKRVLVALKKYGMIYIDGWGDYLFGINAENLEWSVKSHGGYRGWGDIFIVNGSFNTTIEGLLASKFRVIEPLRPPFSSQTYQCNDGIDNNNNGLIDYPNDPGCSSTTDNDESDTVHPSFPTALNFSSVN